MFEDTDAVKHGTRILISKHNQHRVVENVGHILAVFPTVHFSKSTSYWPLKLAAKKPACFKNRQGGLLYTTHDPRQQGFESQITFFLPFRGNSVTAKTAT
jgi:hypothetical protein